MKNIKKALFTICLIVIFSACNLIGIFDEDEPDQTKDYKVVKVMPVDNKGGVIETEDVSFTIPANTLTSSTELRILESDKLNIINNQVSNGFQLTGLPTGYNGAVKIKIKQKGELTHETYIATVQIAKHPQMDVIINNTNYYDTKDSSGYFLATINYENYNQPKTIEKSAEIREDIILAQSGLKREFSPNEPFFRIIYEPNNFSEAKIKVLTEALEKSYKTFNDIGFGLKNKKFKNYLRVNVCSSTETYFGYYNRPFPYLFNNSYIFINATKMNNDETIKATATHELFHYIQDLYGVSDASTTYWIQEALSTWSEELSQDEPSKYIPSGYYENLKRTFHGVEAGQNWEDPLESPVKNKKQHHGYGMSGFIKYMVENSTSVDKRTFTLQLLNALGSNQSNIESFKTALLTQNFTSMVHRFFDKVMQGEVYGKNSALDGNAVRLVLSKDQNEKKIFDIKTKADSLMNFSVNIENLGASVFKVSLAREFTKEEILKLKFATKGNYSDHQYFVYKNIYGYFPVLIKSGQCSSDEVIVQDIKSISEEKHPDIKMLVDKPSILVLITNVDESKDVFGSTNFTLDLKVTQEKKNEFELNTKSVKLKSNFDYYDREEEGRKNWKVANFEIEVAYDLTGYGADIDPDNSDGFVIQFNGKLATIKATGKVNLNPIKLKDGADERNWTQYSFGSPKVEFKSHSESEKYMATETMQDNQYVGTFLTENFYKLLITAKVTVPLIEERYRDSLRTTKIERNLYYSGEPCLIGINYE